MPPDSQPGNGLVLSEINAPAETILETIRGLILPHDSIENEMVSPELAAPSMIVLETVNNERIR